MFEAQNGFVHFAFADDDRYCLPNMVHVHLNDYLFYLLSEKRYERISFVSGMDEFRVLYFDAATSKCWEENRHKSIFKAVSANESYTAENLTATLLKIYSDTNKTAVIFDLNSFYNLFKNNSRLVQELTRRQQQFRQRGNLLVLCSSRLASDSQHILLDKNGPFAFRSGDKQQQFFCREIYDLITRQNVVRLYETMATSLRNRFNIIDCCNETRIGSIVKYTMLLRPDRALDEETTKAFIKYVYACTLSSELGREIFGEQRLSCKLIEERLQEDFVWNVINERVSANNCETAVHQSPAELVEKKYIRRAHSCCAEIYVDSPLVNCMQELKLPEAVDSLAVQHFEEIKLYYSTPWNRFMTETETEGLQCCIDLINDTVRTEEYARTEKCIELLYQFSRGVTTEERAEKIYKSILDVLAYMEKISELNEAILKIDHKMKRDIEKRDEYERELESRKIKNMPLPPAGDNSATKIYWLDNTIAASKKQRIRFESYLLNFNSAMEFAEQVLREKTIVSAGMPEVRASEMAAILEESNRALDELAAQVNEMGELNDEQFEELSAERQEQLDTERIQKNYASIIEEMRKSYTV